MTINKKASLLMLVLIGTGIFFMILSSAISLGLMQQKLNKIKVANAQALNIAEAGINYYKWVLYHNGADYCNKETCKLPPTYANYGPYGPYAYSDQGNEISGKYELYITPPEVNGSGIVVIKSVGYTDAYPNIKRTIEVKLGEVSWASYLLLSNSNIRISEGTQTWGKIHSNGGIRFDGVAHGLVSSALLKYQESEHNYPSSETFDFGVHTHLPGGNPYSLTGDPYSDNNNPPQNLPNRDSDVFQGGRSFPVPVVSFKSLNEYIKTVSSTAQSGGIVLPPSTNYIAGAQGYHIILYPHKVDIEIVKSVKAPCSGHQKYTINQETNNYIKNLDIPENGLIFVHDNVWLNTKNDGGVHEGRVTILAFKDPIASESADITINNTLKYNSYNGEDSIGLIAQRNINIGFESDENLEIDAAMIAKTGKIWRDDYPSNCDNHGNYRKSSLTIYGSMATMNGYGFSYPDNSGYPSISLTYDANLKITPPPHFPTTGEYTFISWIEK